MLDGIITTVVVCVFSLREMFQEQTMFCGLEKENKSEIKTFRTKAEIIHHQQTCTTRNVEVLQVEIG